MHLGHVRLFWLWCRTDLLEFTAKQSRGVSDSMRHHVSSLIRLSLALPTESETWFGVISGWMSNQREVTVCSVVTGVWDINLYFLFAFLTCRTSRVQFRDLPIGHSQSLCCDMHRNYFLFLAWFVYLMLLRLALASGALICLYHWSQSNFFDNFPPQHPKEEKKISYLNLWTKAHFWLFSG